jgi:hypothetical protein
MDDDMQTFRQKTGRRSGCHGCKYADWDADGVTCKLSRLNVWNPAKGCKYRKAQPVTNGDRIRAMTDDEELLSAIGLECYRCAYCNGECDSGYGEGCIAGNLEWLKQEVSEDAES